jgi:DNA-binding LytR/AlgR family response regulator
MTCIIIDDDKTAIDVLTKHCSKIENLYVKRTFLNPKLALKFLNNNKVDFIFLDLHMPKINGYSFINLIATPQKVIITTIDRDSAYRAFEYNCIVDYIEKPYTLERVLQSLRKIEKSISLSKVGNTIHDTHKDLYVEVNKKFVKIPVAGIQFIKRHLNGIEIYTTRRSYFIKSSLNKVMQKLSPSMFIRTHQSYIINLTKITNIKNGMVLINQNKIPVSRSYKNHLTSRINIFK